VTAGGRVPFRWGGLGKRINCWHRGRCIAMLTPAQAGRAAEPPPYASPLLAKGHSASAPVHLMRR